MNILTKLNEVIVKVNTVICNIKNIHMYVGTKDEESLETITGRLRKLEAMIDEDGLVMCEYLPEECPKEWEEDPEEWDDDDSEDDTEKEEW